MTKEKMTIQISCDIYNKVKKRVKISHGDFRSVEEYIEFVLDEVVREDTQKTYSPQDENEVKKRLKSLGYL